MPTNYPNAQSLNPVEVDNFYCVKDFTPNTWDRSSVTRFGEISPLVQTFKYLRQTSECLLCVWQNVKPTLAKVLCYWANFHSCKWPNVKNLSSHLVTLNLGNLVEATIFIFSFIWKVYKLSSILKQNLDTFKQCTRGQCYKRSTW